MQGPDPAILFWLPVGLLLVVIAGGFVVYHVSKVSTRPIAYADTREIGPKPKPPDDYYEWKENAGRVDEWKKP